MNKKNTFLKYSSLSNNRCLINVQFGVELPCPLGHFLFLAALRGSLVENF